MAKKIENNEERNNKQVSIKAMNLVLFIVFFVIFIQAVFVLSRWFISNKRSEKLISDIRKEVIINDNTENKEGSKNPIDFEKLIKQNPDTVGWIKIDGTNIDYPIVKAENNEYYLKRDFDKKSNSCGWIFMDYKNNEEFIDKNTVIYGHNLKSNYMFADLQKIYKKEIDSSIVIKVYTPNELLKYRIFSCYMIGPDDEYAIKSNIVAESDTENYIKEMLKRSEYQYNVVPDKSGKMLTLSTCDKTGEKRILVHCVYIGSDKY